MIAMMAVECVGGTQRAREQSPKPEQQRVERDLVLALGCNLSPLPVGTSQTGYETIGTCLSVGGNCKQILGKEHI